MRTDDAKIADMFALAGGGMQRAEIARRVGVPRWTVDRLLNGAGDRLEMEGGGGGNQLDHEHRAEVRRLHRMGFGPSKIAILTGRSASAIGHLVKRMMAGD